MHCDIKEKDQDDCVYHSWVEYLRWIIGTGACETIAAGMTVYKNETHVV